MDQLYSAAHAASQMYSQSWRRGNIVRCHTNLRKVGSSRRLVNFYLDEIDREVDFIIFEKDVA
jgi:hypothetical protein